MRKFIPEGIARKESLNSALYDGDLEKLVNIRSLCGVSLEHHGYDVRDGGREMRWQGCVVALDNFLS